MNQFETEANLPLLENPEPTSSSLTMEDAFEAQFWDQDAQEIFRVLQLSC